MFLGFLALMAVCFTVLYYIWRGVLFGVVMSVMWILAGAQCYSQRTTAEDIYQLTGTFIIIMGALMAFGVFTSARAGRKEAHEEYIAETMSDLEEELEDAKDNGDLGEAKKVKAKMQQLQEQDEVFNIEARGEFDAHSKMIRAKIRKQKDNRALRAFDEEGQLY